MKTPRLFFLAFLVALSSILASCSRNGDIWENTKSAGRHMKRGMSALTGADGDSRQIRCRDEFECMQEDACYSADHFQDYGYPDGDDYSSGPGHDFIPLHDPKNELGQGSLTAPPPSETPGEQGSSIPGIQAFLDPATIPQLAGIFQPIYFDYDSSLVKGAENLQNIRRVAEFLHSHPHIYVFIEGHTDERGPQAYNLALGARRSNTVRQLLTNEGIHPDRLFTISYGKERPVALDHYESSWAKNRRAEFKIYER